MKSVEAGQEELDLNKTLVFIIFTLVMTLFIATYMIIPDIQQLKISKINTNRSLTMLKSTREYHDKLSEENNILQEKNRKIIEALAASFKKNRLNNFSEEKLGTFKIETIKLALHDNNFVKHEMNVSSNINTPNLLYDYIDKLNEYDSLSEVGFPISIVAKDDYSLDVKFNMYIYELSSK